MATRANKPRPYSDAYDDVVLIIREAVKESLAETKGEREGKRKSRARRHAFDTIAHKTFGAISSLNDKTGDHVLFITERHLEDLLAKER